MVTIENVTFQYSGASRPALDNISLSVADGETVCLMGSNGSGKSTLARLIAGLIEPSRGAIRIDGAPPEPGTRVGLLFQNPDNQMVATLVDKEIAFGLETSAVPLEQMKSQVAEIARSFGVQRLLKRLTTELSGGEKQRVALAAVMVRRPPILVLDEPDSYLDVAGREQLESELRQVQGDNPRLTLIRVTQYPEVAAKSRRLILMHEGRIVADGSPEALLSDSRLLDRCAMSARSVTDPPVQRVMPLMRQQGMPAEIDCRELAFQYRTGKPLLRRLTSRFKRGETVALVGPSGSGKTTLGLLLCGLLNPTGGRIDYLDGNGQQLPRTDIAGRIAMVFQQPERQFFLSRADEEIGFGGRNFGRELAPHEIDAFLDLVGLPPSDFRDRDPFTLSMGEKRRLAMASILALGAPFVLFDEPTNGLDPRGVGWFLQLSQQLRRLGLGQLIISHEGDLVRRLADRVLVLDGEGNHASHSADEFFALQSWRGVVTPPSEND